MMEFPARIVCLTEETTEALYLLGEQDRIVGVSGYTVRPPEARAKPKVSAFLNANYERIIALDPDLVLAFSDLQGDIANELIRRGRTVFTFNQRSVAEILDMVLMIGRIVGCPEKSQDLADRLAGGLDAIRRSAARFPRRPRVFFEEWNDPLISGIRWVDELIEIAGGETLFPALREKPLGRDRILDPSAVIPLDPEVIIASWCGIRFNPGFVRRRAGWDGMSAVRNGHLYEVKSTYILQPGPAALTEGARQIHYLIARALGVEVDPEVRPGEKTDRAAG
jgi:iron complex transport system substrate-binding protein